MSAKKKLKPVVNCWFCNQDSSLQSEKTSGWLCQNCDQYNGFTAEGDYNIEVPGQHDVQDQKTGTICEAGAFHCAPSLLCAACSTNQILYVRQLATFKSMSEDSYDEELESYREYLDDVYRLCPTCESGVKEHIDQQDQLLQSKMSQPQQEKLRSVKEPLKAAADCTAAGIRRLRPPCIPTLMFLGCFLLAGIHTIVCLRLYAVTVVSGVKSPVDRHPAWFGRFMLWVVAAIPAQHVFAAQEIVIYLGATLCLAGLFSSGKYSLYLEDCVHPLMWLVTLVSWVEWIHVSEGSTLAVAILTVLLALVACFRPRQPRHLSQLLFFRKNVNALGVPNKMLEADTSDATRSTISETLDSRSSSPSVSSSSLPFDEVCQDLETFSIGLNKKSESKSSIWSLPAVVASCLESGNSPTAAVQSVTSDPMSPDSTTGDQAPPQRPDSPRSVLSPSRLGFVSFDSNPGSRCPSPWDPLLEESHDGDLASENSVAGVPSLSRPASPTHDKFYGAQLGAESGQSHLQSSSRKESALPGHQDVWRRGHPHQPSPGPHVFYPQLSSSSTHGQRGVPLRYPGDQHKHNAEEFEGDGAGCELSGVSGYHQQEDALPQTGGVGSNHSVPGEAQGVRRRSQRLAMAGKLPKPWPLRKSLSCNDAIGRKNVDRAGAASGSESLRAPIPSSLHAPMIPMTQHNTPQHYRWRALTPLREKGNKQFSEYRDGSNPTFSQSLHPNTGFDCSRKTGEKNMYSTSRLFYRKDDQIGKQSEFSDDEEMEVDESWSNSGLKQRPRTSHSNGGDMSLRWILLGTLIGASVTCNIFLFLHGWLQR